MNEKSVTKREDSLKDTHLQDEIEELKKQVIMLTEELRVKKEDKTKDEMIAEQTQEIEKLYGEI